MRLLRGSITNDSITGYNGRDEILSEYGNDVINGANGDDLVDGGRGNDTITGGAGNDRVFSRSDTGEGAIAQDVNAGNDPNGEVDAATKRIYANQTGLPGDDVLSGGAGADLFQFDTLVNAKRAILEKHTDPNTGAIDWHGVTGENNLVHDHWVDGIGNDVITDFNKAEGDTLKIEGHTTEVYQIEIIDADGDGAADDTVLHLRSNQGANGGAHNLDLLGTITVLNNQLTANDFSVNAGAHHGVVGNISEVNEAILPYNPGATAAPPADDTGGSGDDGGAGAGGDTGSGGGAGSGGSTGSGSGAGSGSGTGGSAGGGYGGGSGSGTGSGSGSGTGAGSDDGHNHGGGGSGSGGSGAGAGSGTGSGSGAGTGSGTGSGGDSGAGAGSGSGSSGGDTGAGGGGAGGGGGTGGNPSPTLSVVDQMLQVPDGAVAGQAPTTGDDVIIYGDGDERGNGGMGNDLVVGLAGDDSLSGGWGDDRVDGGEGDDHAHGNHGDDFIAGRDGDDGLAGDFGSDILVGGAGNDELRGSRGDDVLLGGADDDELRGGTGDDILMGGAGNDQIRGGSGQDGLLLEGAIADYTVEVDGNEVRFTDGDGATDVVTGVEQYRFLGSGETYQVEDGALALTADTELIDELLEDHSLEHLIEEELAAGGTVAPAAPAAGATAAAPADAAVADQVAVPDPDLLAA